MAGLRVRRADDDEVAAIAESSAHWTDPLPSGEWWVLDDDPEHGYAGADVRDGTVHLTRCYVASTYRGRGGQRALILVRLRWGRAQGADRAETYTHLSSVASARNLIACGFTLRGATTEWLTWERNL
jgi:GNAT superfamily N-acetyltransferase